MVAKVPPLPVPPVRVKPRGAVPSVAQAVNVTDYDAMAIAVFLMMLQDKHTDEEILAILTPEKLRRALTRLREERKHGKA